jgi:hypothetical protein
MMAGKLPVSFFLLGIISNLTLATTARAQEKSFAEALIPDRTYSGHKEKSGLTKKHICQGRSQYAFDWKLKFDEVELDILPGRSALDLRFFLKDLSFNGENLQHGSWTCRDSGTSAKVLVQDAMIALKVIPSKKGNARFEISNLKLEKIQLSHLSKTILGVRYGIDTLSPVWNSGVESYFNRLAAWILNSSLSNIINDFLSKEVARLVESYFGEAPQKVTAQTENLRPLIEEEWRGSTSY